MIAPVSVARSIIAAGLKRSCAYQSTSASTSRPFGVGVDHLDGVALHRAHHVARALRLAVGHVLHQPDQPDDVGRRLAQRQRLHDAGDHAGAAHVHGHLLHALRRLDRDAAGVEDHALADRARAAPPRRRPSTASPRPWTGSRSPAPPRGACACRALELAAPPAPRPRRRDRAGPSGGRRTRSVVSTFAGSLTRSRVKIDPLGLRRRAAPRRPRRPRGRGPGRSPRGSAPRPPSRRCGRSVKA